MSELERLRLSEIPAGRERLREQHGNLLRVAEYCHSNYLQAGDKRRALQETMALSTQSLASVTYQVSSLARAFLRLMDLQAAQLRQLEADVTCVAQSVDIHKEKVSRREIGALTVTRRCLSFQKVLPPPEPPVLEPYYRRPLNFSVLDGVGHGVKVGALGWHSSVPGVPECPRCPLRGARVALTSSPWRTGVCPCPLSFGGLAPHRGFASSGNPTGGVWEPHGSCPTAEIPTGGVWEPQSPTEPLPALKGTHKRVQRPLSPTDPPPLQKSPAGQFSFL
uniref:ABI family member 3 n=1 Tax=Junco hyemalis TaxID=40217 RepID=A0A8C5IWR8_JUNHY